MDEEDRKIMELRERIQDLDEAVEDAQVMENEAKAHKLWEEARKAEDELHSLPKWQELKDQKTGLSGWGWLAGD